MIQFIKGTWPNGERNLLEPHGVEFQVMATGFTWNTQDRDSDTAACLAVWEHARRMLADDQLDLVLLDELTYMVAYDYLPLESVLSALRERPAHQSVIITGRGCHRDIIELADTVSELRPVKHAFDAGIKAQMGIDYRGPGTAKGSTRSGGNPPERDNINRWSYCEYWNDGCCCYPGAG